MMNSTQQLLILSSFLLVSIIQASDFSIFTGKERISTTFTSSQADLYKNSMLLQRFDLSKLKSIHVEVLEGNPRIV